MEQKQLEDRRKVDETVKDFIEELQVLVRSMIKS